MRGSKALLLKKGKRSVKRPIPPDMLKRLQKTETSQLLSWMDTTLMALGQASDNWRFHGAEAGEVTLCLNAMYAIWEELQVRGKA